MLGLVVSVNITVFALVSAILLSPFVTLNALLYWLWLMLCADVIIGAGGILWHTKAIFDHRAHLRMMHQQATQAWAESR